MKEEEKEKAPENFTLNRVITMPAKLNSQEYLHISEAAKLVGKNHSDFLRTATLIEADRVFKKPSELQPITTPKEISEIEMLKFRLEALSKYFAAEKLQMPTEEELIKLWVEGKKETAPFGRVKVLVEPKELPDFKISNKILDEVK